MKLEGAVALVTGSGHRVGRAIALELARAGAHQVVHYNSSQNEAAETRQRAEALGVEAMVVQANVADPDEIAGLVAQVEARFGRLDVLVNSAASFKKQSFHRIGVADWDRTMNVNLRGPFLMLQAAASLLGAEERGAPGSAVNIADLSGQFPWRGYIQHGVSKAGLLHLTRIAARELGPKVRVNAVIPGPVLPPPGVDPESDDWQRRGDDIPAGRTGDPQHVARAVRFLCENQFVTGATLHVDGGEHLLGPAGH